MISKRLRQQQHNRLASRLNILLALLFVIVVLEGLLAGVTVWRNHTSSRQSLNPLHSTESHFYNENPEIELDPFSGEDESVNGHADRPAQLVIVIDDFGYFIDKKVEGFIGFPWPITLAVMPGLAQSKQIARLALENNKEVILHLPMEAVNPKLHREPYMITSDMSREKVAEVVSAAIRSVPGARGMNNHIGSLATQHESIMREVVRQCILHRLHILDSITHPKTVFYRVAREAGAPSAQRDIFLDHYSDEERIREELHRAVRLSRKRGRPVIAIGHVRSKTLKVLDAEAPALVEQGVSFLPLSAVTETEHIR